MAVAPLFNPNTFETFKAEHWRNQAITDCFEPGSTMKAFLMAAALDKGIATPQTTFFCENGAYTIGAKTIHEHDAKKYGSLTLTEIVTVSSNIGAVKVGQKLGYKKFHEYLRRFGFGEKTGLDLIGEREGYVRPPKDSREIDKATVYFGQGVTTTSLQLVMAMGAIANQGVLMKPFLVKAIKDQQGRTVKEFHPQIVRRVISPEAARSAAQILENVVSEKGTAKLAAIGGYRVAGKTGTSQKVDPRTKAYSRRAHMAVFVGFVPSDDPRLSMVVVVDEPAGIPYGGVVSAPIFRQVGAWTLNHLRVNPQTVVAEAVVAPEASGQVRTEPKSQAVPGDAYAGLLPDFRGQTMREVIKEGNSLGIRVTVEGTGLAVGQVPAAGLPLEKVSAVRVSFMPPM
jgi:cell division protein FtsI (penicillin-binding protein 3)